MACRLPLGTNFVGLCRPKLWVGYCLERFTAASQAARGRVMSCQQNSPGSCYQHVPTLVGNRSGACFCTICKHSDALRRRFWLQRNVRSPASPPIMSTVMCFLNPCARTVMDGSLANKTDYTSVWRLHLTSRSLVATYDRPSQAFGRYTWPADLWSLQLTT